MDALIAEVAVAGVPNPMPVIVETVFRKGLQRCRTSPEIIIDAGRYGFLRHCSNRIAPLVAEAAREIDVTHHAITHFLNTFDDGSAIAAVGAVLHDTIVFFRGASHLTAFPPVMAHGLLNINILARLTTPYGHERVPMIRGGDRDRVDRLVIQELADVDEGRGLLKPHLLHRRQTLPHNVLIDVADRGDFHIGHLGILTHMQPSLPVETDDGDANAVVRAKYPLGV